jgi:hypothetical protein
VVELITYMIVLFITRGDNYASEYQFCLPLVQIVFRSASCQMFLLVQISSEMWDFDTSGDDLDKINDVIASTWGPRVMGT